MTTVCTLLILAHLEVLPVFQHRERTEIEVVMQKDPTPRPAVSDA